MTKKTGLFLALILLATNSFAAVKYEPYMRQLIELSHQNPHYPFATMIIDNQSGKILCEGVNKGSVNPTFHGEIVAINNCAKKFPTLDWSQTTLITTAEPCPMCESAIIWAGISKVVYGTSIAFLAKHGWHQIYVTPEELIKKAPFYKGTVIGGVLHHETDKLFVVSTDQSSLEKKG